MKKTALLFAGQGAQYVGMAKDLAEQCPTAAEWFARAEKVLGYDVAEVCFNGPDPELTKTENCQPAIFLTSWIAFQLLKERAPHLRFQATAGLSLGELTALTAAGVFSFEDGLRIARQRGRFMQEACDLTQGGMAAIVGLDEAPTAEVCAATGVEIANLNCPGQIVISGEASKIAAACEMAKAKGAKRAIALPVAGAYHSRLMASGQPKVKAMLDTIQFHAPEVQVMSNVTAKPHVATEIKAKLVDQVTSPVRWEQCIRHLVAHGFTQFIELGPGTALTGFLKRIDKTASITNVADVPSLEAAVKSIVPLVEPKHEHRPSASPVYAGGFYQMA